MNSKLGLIVACTALLAIHQNNQSANAALVVNLTHDGGGGVIASVSGSGFMSTASLPPTEPTNRLLIDDLGPGDPFSSNVNFTSFNLANPMVFASGINITQIIIDDDGGPGLDDIFFPLSASLSTTPIAFNASGSSQVNGLSFSDLTIGTYTSPNHPVSVELGGFTLNIRDQQVSVPEPATAALGLMGVAGLMMRRRRAA